MHRLFLNSGNKHIDKANYEKKITSLELIPLDQGDILTGNRQVYGGWWFKLR